MVEGLCSHIDHNSPDLQFQCSWYVTSLSLLALNQRFDLSVCTVTFVVIEGVGQVRLQVIAVKYAWILSIQLLLILVFQSGLSS
jgi:hypothetical protein